jgi:hypothetical protein
MIPTEVAVQRLGERVSNWEDRMYEWDTDPEEWLETLRKHLTNAEQKVIFLE